MASNVFKDPHFHDENAACAWFEAARWPNGPVCPHCKAEKHYASDFRIAAQRFLR